MDVIKVKRVIPVHALPKLKYILGLWRLWKSRRYPVFRYIPQIQTGKKRLLFYDVGGLSFAGTQKSLQILAKHLNKELFDVYFMYSSKFSTARLDYLQNSGIRLIDFSFSERTSGFPFYLEHMQPHIFEVLKQHDIDLVVAAGSGYPEFPVANITKLPIVHLNIFGSVNPQKNVIKHLCISDYLTERVSAVLRNRDVETLYIQSEGPDTEAFQRGCEIRQDLGLEETDIVFGRIGRPDNNIFDPIGIRAFQKIVARHPNAHYLIMSPPPVLEELVRKEHIPNVHFIPPSGKEQDVWAFHNAIDALAHFRRDGETMGLNIAESMLCGKPVISHISTVWNAHLEYLEPSFSRIAGIDDVGAYEKYMEEFIQTGREKLSVMGSFAQEKADKLFLIKNNIKRFEECVLDAIQSK